MQKTECSRCKHWIQTGSPHKNPAGNATNLPSKLPDFPLTPSTPNNSPVNSPCLPPLLTLPLQPRFEDSGSKERLTTTLGKATTSSIHGGVTMIAVTPGTVARRWVAMKIMQQSGTITVNPGTPAQLWVVTKVRATPRNSYKPLIMMPTTKTTSNEQGCTLPHHGTSLLNKNMMSLTTSSPTLFTNNSPITLHSECFGNASLSMISHVSASTYAWTAPHKDSLGRSRLLTLIM